MLWRRISDLGLCLGFIGGPLPARLLLHVVRHHNPEYEVRAHVLCCVSLTYEAQNPNHIMVDMLRGSKSSSW